MKGYREHIASKRLAWVVACVGIVMVGCNRQPTIDDRIAEQEATAKKNGWSPLPSQIAKEIEAPPEENAAIGVKEALQEMASPPYKNSTEPFLRGYKPAIRKQLDFINSNFLPSIDSADLRIVDLEVAIQKVEPYISKIETALKKPRWDFNRKYTRAITALDPEISMLKDLCRAFSTRAYIRAIKGNKQAIQDLRTLVRLAAHCSKEPSLLFISLAVASTLHAYSTTERIASACWKDKQLIGQLRDIWSQEMLSIDYHRLWRMRLAEELLSVDYVASDSGLQELYAEGLGKASPEAAKAIRLQILKIGNESLSSWQGDHRSLKSAREATLEPAAQISKLLSSYHKLFEYFGSPGTSPMSNILEGVDAALVAQRLSYVALHMIESGASSSNYVLPSIAKEKEWLDPYSNKPLLLKLTEKGFILYSVGENQKDDGANPKIVNGQRLDIVWTFNPVTKGN